MEQNPASNEALIARVEQLQRERDELRKDIEQLCMQQTGPGYLGVATRMQFQRMVGLEQEVESLQSKLAVSIRENQNLQEELSEAYRIKTQLADLHSAEVLKNLEAEKQLKFFQNCVAAAFAERDSAIMEAEKSKEKVELMPQELERSQIRIKELTEELRKEKEMTEAVHVELEKHEMQNVIFKEVIDKFYEIRQCSLEIFTDATNEEKCESLMNDSDESWSFQNDQETSTSNYISSLEAEIETLRKRVDNLQNKLKVGLEIETHLKKQVRKLEKKKILSEDKIKEQISSLHHHYSQFKTDVRNLLDESCAELKAIFDEVVEKIELNGEHNQESSTELYNDLNESECRDVHVSDVDLGPASTTTIKDDDCVLPTVSAIETSNSSEALAHALQEKVEGSVLPAISAIETSNASEALDQALQDKVNDLVLPTLNAIETSNATEALAQALQEKVAALLLLSQEEERYLLERNVSVALQKKVEELQRNLLQVTNEKVKALMELAQLKQDFYMMQDKTNEEKTKGTLVGEIREQRVAHDKDGKLKNLLKRSYLTRWVGGSDVNDADAHSSDKQNQNMDLARMRIEYATLKESLESMEHLLSSVRRLRMSLFKVTDSSSEKSKTTSKHYDNDLDKVIAESKLLMTALSSSLPISWSAQTEASFSERTFEGDSDKVDFVSAVGLEMIELLIFAAEVLKQLISRSSL